MKNLIRHHLAYANWAVVSLTCFALGSGTFFLGCSVDRSSSDLAIQFSAEKEHDYMVVVTKEAQYSPSCREIFKGNTVLFRNTDENIPVRILSTDEPYEMVSPLMRGDYKEWKHTFSETGVFDFYDPFSGDLGRPVVDSYYGTTTFIGSSGTVTRGRICVKKDLNDTETCAQQCCSLGLGGGCSAGQECKNGICLDP